MGISDNYWDRKRCSVTVKFEDYQLNKNKIYSYIVDDSNDEEVFENQCLVLEQRIPGLV